MEELYTEFTHDNKPRCCSVILLSLCTNSTCLKIFIHYNNGVLIRNCAVWRLSARSLVPRTALGTFKYFYL